MKLLDDLIWVPVAVGESGCQYGAGLSDVRLLAGCFQMKFIYWCKRTDFLVQCHVHDILRDQMSLGYQCDEVDYCISFGAT